MVDLSIVFCMFTRGYSKSSWTQQKWSSLRTKSKIINHQPNRGIPLHWSKESERLDALYLHHPWNMGIWTYMCTVVCIYIYICISYILIYYTCIYIRNHNKTQYIQFIYTICIYIYIYVWLYVCMSVCLYVCMSVCVYVYVYVCMYACMYVCMHACMNVCIQYSIV